MESRWHKTSLYLRHRYNACGHVQWKSWMLFFSFHYWQLLGKLELVLLGRFHYHWGFCFLFYVFTVMSFLFFQFLYISTSLGNGLRAISILKHIKNRIKPITAETMIMVSGPWKNFNFSVWLFFWHKFTLHFLINYMVLRKKSENGKRAIHYCLI